MQQPELSEARRIPPCECAGGTPRHVFPAVPADEASHPPEQPLCRNGNRSPASYTGKRFRMVIQVRIHRCTLRMHF